jgi:hypothetical protein
MSDQPPFQPPVPPAWGQQPSWGPPPASPPTWGPPPTAPPAWGMPPTAPPQPPPAAWGPPPKKRSTALWVILGGIFCVLLVLAVVAGVAAGRSGSRATSFGVGVGDCFDNPNDPGSGDLKPVKIVDCDDDHDREAYVVDDLRGAADAGFPGTDQLVSEASDTCLDAFEGYVGSEFLDSTYNFEPIVPTEGQWDDGAREFVCALLDTSGAKTSGSAKDSGR